MGIARFGFRCQNVAREGDVSGTGQFFRHVRGEETLRRAAEAAGWDTPKPGPGFGRGIALGQRPQGRAVSIARVVVDARGRVTLASSVPDTGVGFYSVGRQVVAEDLGLGAEEVGLARLDTDAVPFDTGAGAGTSVGAAHAALGAAQDVRHQLTHLAAEFYVWPQERIVFRHGRVFVDDAPESGVSFHALAARAVAALGHPVVGEMTTTAEEPEGTAYCAQVAEGGVDPDTGQVTVHRIVTAHDVGTIINPLDHQGQIDGAVMQGLGYALMEGLHADEGRISTLSLGEAKIPTMQDIPTLI